MNNDKQQRARRVQTFGKYVEPIEVDGRTAQLYAITETVVNDVNGDPVVLDRKKEPLFDMTKEKLIEGLTGNVEKFKAEHQVALESMMSQLNALTNL